MKKAFLISAYTDPCQLGNLLDTLADEEHWFFIHIDNNVDITPFMNIVDGRQNVRFVTNRYSVNWGGYTQVLYQFEMLRSCIDSGIQFQRVFIITGQDFPLVDKTDMEKELQENSQKEYIVGLNLSEFEHGTPKRRMFFPSLRNIIRLSLPQCQRERLTLYHYRDIHAKFLKDKTKRGISRVLLLIARLIPIRKMPYLEIGGKRWDVYLSSSYMCITMPLAKYVYKTMTTYKEIEHYFRHSFVPEEMVIPTIVFNSSYGEHATLNPHQRYDGLISLSAVTYFEYGKGIKVFDERDIDELLNSGRMFARKFSSTKSRALIRRLSEIWGNENVQVVHTREVFIRD